MKIMIAFSKRHNFEFKNKGKVISKAIKNIKIYSKMNPPVLIKMFVNENFP